MRDLIEVGNVLDNSMMTAAEMTHALCEIGNGSMGEGIRNVFEGGIQLGRLEGHAIGWESGWKDGHIRGLITGASIVGGGVAIVGLCAWGVKKYRTQKAVSLSQANITEGDESLQREEVQESVVSA